MTIYKLKQRGDTIVEVMVSVAMTALILTSAFILANDTTKSTRQAQERGEALNIAQGEAEELISYLATSTLPSIGSFCLDLSSDPRNIVSSNSTQCDRQNLYRVETTPSSLDNTYDVRVVWSSVKNNGDDNLIMTVRTYAK